MSERPIMFDRSTLDSVLAQARQEGLEEGRRQMREEARAALYGAREVCGSIGNIQHAIDLLDSALKEPIT